MSLTGNLRVPNLVGVIQLVCLERAVARLHVRAGAREGHIYFADGQAVHAEFEDLLGDAAFERILSIEGGAFELTYGTVPPRQTITQPVEAMLLDVFRRKDEAKRALSNGLGTLTRALVAPGLARGLILVEHDGTILTEQKMADPEACARLVADIVREVEGIGTSLRLGAVERVWVHAPDGRCLAVIPHGPRWVGIEAERGPAGRRLAAALDEVLAGAGRAPAEE